MQSAADAIASVACRDHYGYSPGTKAEIARQLGAVANMLVPSSAEGMAAANQIESKTLRTIAESLGAGTQQGPAAKRDAGNLPRVLLRHRDRVCLSGVSDHALFTLLP